MPFAEMTVLPAKRAPHQAVALRELPAARPPQKTAAQPSQPDGAFPAAQTALRARSYSPPAHLQRFDDRLQWCLRQPQRRTSVRPLTFGICTGAGKFGIGLGAYLLSRGLDQKHRIDVAAGASTLAAAFAVFLYGALSFGAAVDKLSRTRGFVYKTLSISGGVSLAAGFALGGLATGDARDHRSTPARLAPAAIAFGTFLMAFTLPQFVRLSEAVLGDLPLGRHRAVVWQGTSMAGLGLLASLSPIASFCPVSPFASQGMTAIASFACLLGMGIACSSVYEQQTLPPILPATQ